MGAPKFWMLWRIGFVLAVAGACCGARAEDGGKKQALQAAIVDTVSGAAVLATGVFAVNPLGPVLSIGMKAATLRYAESLPEHERPAAYASATAMWAGTTVGNLCVTAAFIASGGALVPVCVALGAAWGMKTWNDGEQERLWQTCASLRDFAQPPNFECVNPLHAADQRTAGTRLRSAAELTAP
jgi:hypothetical protein